MSNGVSPGDFRQEWQILNRLYTAQIVHVNERKGTVNIVILDGLGSKKDNVEIPHKALSIDGHKSSWIRYMPQVRDLVFVAFGPKNDPRIVGYGSLPGQYAELTNIKTKTPTKFPRGDFADLRQGEWDMRSSGGAYVYGNRDGALLISAGPLTQIRYNKKDNEIRGETGLWVQASSGSFVRTGEVRRTLLPSDFKETRVDATVPLDPLAFREHWLHLENPPSLPGQPATVLVDEQYGAVRDGLGLPYVGSIIPGTPLRYRRKIWAASTLSIDPFPLVAHSIEVDALGNESIEYGPTTTGVEIVGGPLTAASADFLSIDASATADVAISAGVDATLSALGIAEVSGTILAKLVSELVAQVDATVVQLGTETAAIHPALRGEVLATLLGAFAATGSTAFTTLASFDPPPSPKGIAFTSLAAACTALAAGLAATLSTKVFVE